MPQFRGSALLPTRFVFQHLFPAMAKDPFSWNALLKAGYRRYFSKRDPEMDVPVGQISLRVNEVCNLRCKSCGQWGENGHLQQKLERGEKLEQLDFEVVKRLMLETRHDKPFYYIWGGEPTMWKPLVPFFREMGRHKLYGSIVSNAQALGPILEELIDTGALSILYLSLDGWDAESQNIMRSPANKSKVDNFEKTLAVIEKTHEIKRRKNLKTPLVMPITVISDENYLHLADIHRLVMDKTQLHPYYFGWFITEEDAALHEKVFENRFGYLPKNHRGYLKSCFNDVDPAATSEQIKEVLKIAKGHASVPHFLPDIYSEEQIRRYYEDHKWSCGYNSCESIYYTAEISPNGQVTPCRDYQDFDAGNINVEPFCDIWNGDKFKEFRRQMKKGLMPVCTRCCGLQGF
ncbi:MAG: radical SAM protein [Chitinivibrionales bacterium]|nr:radical SAM protein [Chitinivibrionales bacterium]